MTDSTSFRDLGISPDLTDLLDSQGIISPFPIQEAAIPDALSGRDLCGRARTGSGKTLAFGLPMVQTIKEAQTKRPRALVLTPTRELCSQVGAVLSDLAAVRDFEIIEVYGGAPMQKQIDALKRGVEIVVATPGRLIDLLERKAVRLDDIAVVAIDEADQMADMGFLPQVRRIMRTVPEDHQTLLFSATLDGQVGALIKAYMDDPVYHEVSPTTVAVETMEHRFLKVHYMDKVRVAARIARSAGRTLMFTRTKHGADRLVTDLREEGIKTVAIHGDKQQRHREKALARFASGDTPVLVATNVAARGLHIEGVDLVVHYDPPDDPKTYLHRSGRTARAGEEGLVVTLVEWDQVNEVLRIQKEAGLSLPLIKMLSNNEALDDLTSWEPDEADLPPAGPDTKAAAARRRMKTPGRRRRRR
ncbi:MAG: DEAD/DEAH box helicase [Acidimicrobiia bacterium]|nr:DEAD/DEAH box helicase [Acidimicrobiia bacterium]